MKRSLLLLLAALMPGCLPPQSNLPPDALPHPIGELSLPVYPPSSVPKLHLEVRAFITADGTVREAQFSPHSGNDLWDSLAVSSIRRWRFTPAMQGGAAVSVWIRFPMTVHFGEPRPVTLAEIVCPTRELADSLYSLLLDGADFGVLARQFSSARSRTRDGHLGKVNLGAYSLTVQMTVTSIGEGEVTGPLRIGDGYVIFKRVGEGVQAGR